MGSNHRAADLNLQTYAAMKVAYACQTLSYILRNVPQRKKRNERKSNKNTDFSSYSLHCNSDSTTQPSLQYLFVNKIPSRFKRSWSATGKKSIPTNILSFFFDVFTQKCCFTCSSCKPIQYTWNSLTSKRDTDRHRIRCCESPVWHVSWSVTRWGGGWRSINNTSPSPLDGSLWHNYNPPC